MNHGWLYAYDVRSPNAEGKKLKENVAVFRHYTQLLILVNLKLNK